MRITCPECQFKGLIDTAPLAFETRVACVRCGTTFDAMLVDGEVRTSLPSATEEHLPTQAITPDFDPEMTEDLIEVEEVLALPPTPDADYQLSEETPVLDAVLSASPVEQEAEPEDAPALQMEETAAAEQSLVSGEFTAASLAGAHSAESAAASEDEPSLKFKRPFAEASAEHDRHGLRLMRISPLWLLICGVTFVAVIVLSNKFARPADQEHQVATNFAASSNKATNQAATQPLAPASNKATATSVQDASPALASAPVETAQETKAIEEQAVTKKQSEPQPAPVIVPVVDTKREAVYAPGPESEQAGSLTVQVGSYNVIEQANERVARLQAAGFSARVATIELPKRGTWYRVQAGRFSNREEAARYGNELKSKGAADSFIIADAAGGK
jgi:cell division protein FtsN